MRRTDLAGIRRARLLSGVPEAKRAALLSACFVQALPVNALLCRQGETPDFLYVVISGRVGLFGEAERGEALVEIFGPGDALIVPAVALDKPSLLTARMLDEGRVLMWPAADFRAQLLVNGPLANGAMLQLCDHWRLLVGQIKDLKLLPAVERLVALLISLAPRGADQVDVMLPGNRGLVAGLLGVAPQSLSRAFADLRPLGVSGGGREVSITSISRLRQFASTRQQKEDKGKDTVLARRLSHAR